MLPMLDNSIFFVSAALLAAVSSLMRQIYSLVTNLSLKILQTTVSLPWEIGAADKTESPQ